MSIAEQTLETLEFPKIRERLTQYTAFSASRALALALLPSVEREEVEQRLRLTSEARRLLDEHPEVSIGGARDVREMVEHAARGGVLETGTLLEISNTLRSMRRLHTMLLKLNPAAFPLLLEYVVDLPQLPELEEQIELTIGDEGTVLDSASPALGRIRKEVRIFASRLNDRLHGMITSGQYASILQEPIVTVRDGRYVLPVKAAQRRALPGLVHDQSASGATLYVEPMAVVELNNQWREAQLAEEQEVQRILAALSDKVGAAAYTIVAGVDTLALLDLYFAQAKYALALRCVQPELTILEAQTEHGELTDHPLLLTAARHPLLDQSTVVPVDVWMGQEFRLLLITGPNTGGKTVALKTVGLLALMAQAGLHIPAREPSRLPVFHHVFADIGDEQSIEQSLSTFSSHMTNIIRILGAIDAAEEIANTAWEQPPPATLVLLDELGAGTDPVEGSALARAICGRLLERGCLAVCTTHYADLKVFAHNTPGVQNASVEFDVETLAPTYRLTIGLPGRSNALAIATRLGLDASLVELARGMVTRDDLQIENLLANIHREREAASHALQRAEEVRKDAEKYRERYAQKLEELETALQERVDAANRELEHNLRDIENELGRLRNESRSATLSRQWAQEAEQRLQAMRSQVQATGRDILASMPRSPDAQDTAAGGNGTQMPPRPLQAGDTVLVRSVGLQGEILTIDEEDQTADVQVGGFRLQVGLNELRRGKHADKAGKADKDTPQPAEQRERERPAAPSAGRIPAVPDVSMEFDMRGWRAAEVSNRLDRYLNDAYLAGYPFVRLIHGKGSGVLRQVVRDMLQQHALIASFSGGGAEGGEGVTIARFNR